MSMKIAFAPEEYGHIRAQNREAMWKNENWLRSYPLDFKGRDVVERCLAAERSIEAKFAAHEARVRASLRVRS